MLTFAEANGNVLVDYTRDTLRYFRIRACLTCLVSLDSAALHGRNSHWKETRQFRPQKNFWHRLRCSTDTDLSTYTQPLAVQSSVRRL